LSVITAGDGDSGISFNDLLIAFATLLGLRHLPREMAAFEVEVFFHYSAEEAGLSAGDFIQRPLH
jgi:hypothetical protein